MGIRDPNIIRPLWPYGINHTSRQADGLVLWYPFALEGGEKLIEFVRGNHGALTGGPNWSAGPMGAVNAITFDGTDDYVACGSPTLGLATNGFSVSLWVYFKSTPPEFDMIASQTFNDSWNSGWGIHTSASMGIQFWVQQFNGNQATTPTLTLLPNRWQHVVGTWNKSVVNIYLDNRLTTGSSYSGAYTDGNPLELGRGRNNAYNLNGKLADFRIYNRALTAGEVQALYDPQTRYELFWSPWRELLGVGTLPTTVNLDALSNSPTLYAPSVNQQITPDLLSAAQTLPNPTVSQAVLLDALSNQAALFAPSLNQVITPDAVASTAAVHSPSVNQAVTIGALAVSTTLPDVQVNQAVTIGALSNPVILASPSVNQIITIDALANASTLPSIAAGQLVSLDALSNLATALAPSTNQVVLLGALALPLGLPNPSAGMLVALAGLNNPVTLPAISVGQGLVMGTRPSTLALYPPTVTHVSTIITPRSVDRRILKAKMADKRRLKM